MTLRWIVPLAVSMLATPVLGAGDPPASTVSAAKATGPSSADVARIADSQEKALSGPIDPERYIVGPGDRFAVTVLAPGVQTVLVTVTPEGNLIVPGVATLAVAGKTLRETKDLVASALGLRRGGGTEVALVGLRRMEVHVLGVVARPGTYVGTATDVAGRMVDAAGGLAEGGSRRNITVTRRDGTTRRVDLVLYANAGDVEANPPIIDGDIIHVPYEKQWIVVDGAVEAPGRYEYVPGDTVGSLLRIAGGLQASAWTESVELRRFDGNRNTEEQRFPADDAGRARPLRDGDQLYVPHRVDFRQAGQVTVEGEVRFPGPYGIIDDQDLLSSVIAKAGGFTEAASLGEAHLIRDTAAELPDLEFERLKSIPVQDMSGTEYAYFKTKARERKGIVVVDFARLSQGDSTQDRTLRPGDRIIVPRQRSTVTVSGNVTHPGLVTFEPGRKAPYYVSAAGGYSSNADRGGTRVIKASTGEWESPGRAGEIVPGDEIWIPEKPERDWWQITQDVVRFAASVATVYLVIDQATGN